MKTGLKQALKKSIIDLRAVEKAHYKKIKNRKDVDKHFEEVRKARLKVRDAYDNILDYNYDAIDKVELPDSIKFHSQLATDSLFTTTYGSKQFFHNVPDEPFREKLISIISAFTGVSHEKANKLIYKYKGDSNTVELLTKAISYNPAKNFVCVDIETTSLDPELGDIIEIAIVEYTPDGQIVNEYQSYFDKKDEDFKFRHGIGLKEIHGISPESLVGCRTFSDESVQDEISKLINRKDIVLVAHNDDFEFKWLSTHLKDFYKTFSTVSDYALQHKSTPIAERLDTRALSMSLQHSQKRSRLQEFVSDNGLNYENAHSALPDVKMTMSAFFNFRDEILKCKSRI